MNVLNTVGTAINFMTFSQQLKIYFVISVTSLFYIYIYIKDYY